MHLWQSSFAMLPYASNSLLCRVLKFSLIFPDKRVHTKIEVCYEVNFYTYDLN